VQFSTGVFVFVFMPIALLSFLLARSVQLRQVLLVVAGYVFYGYHDWRYCALLAAITVVGFAAARLIEGSTGTRRARLTTAASLTTVLGVLWFFKYFDFFAGSLNALAGGGLVPVLSIALPLGLSFYAFNSISYIVDVSAKRTKASRSLLEYSAAVSFFPQLISGPLVRFHEIVTGLRDPRGHALGDRIVRGGWFFTSGLAKKVIIADSLARCVDPLVADVGSLSTLAAWQAALGYAFQIYYDFSGYSDMAVGLGLMFGIELPWNFDRPYNALGIRDFWRRWHISLSRWLRDYVFLPVSYSLSRKVGEFRALGFNQDYWIYATATLLTMALAGLWHGARWTFVVWGCYHGILLTTDQFGSKRLKRLPRPAYGLCTFLCVVMGWVVFRSPDLNTAVSWMHRMVVPVSSPAGAGPWGLSILLVACSVAVVRIPEIKDLKAPLNVRTAVIQGFLLFVSLLFMNNNQAAFLYYQF
jgi:alginate O-acetyltransferase complex protein AlgI